jgi:hypothetical protein
VSPLDLIPGWVKLAILAALTSALVGLYAWHVHVERETGRAEIRAEWTAAALAESQANSRETFRRLERQQENQLEQDKQLALARDGARRNAADADRLRTQSADAARRWRDATRDSADSSVCQAAGAAIVVQADVLSRADRRAGELAAFADTSRAAGLKCQADYQALTP